METIRSFIALELPHNIKDFLKRIEDGLKSGCPAVVKWVNPENIHLTLKFLGNIEVSKISAVTGVIDESTRAINPFNLRVSQIGVFPHLKNIQVIWIGLSGDIDTLFKLQRNIESNLLPLGFPVEKRPFTAHLTLARISDYATFDEKQKISKIISEFKPEFEISFPVNAVSFIKSQLNRTGAVYNRLSLVELKSSCN
jgi:RNA 2',3'-cyclic 3'-phosphodiesterase